MSHNNCWIETADAREFVTMAVSERRSVATETYRLHLGATVAKVVAWWQHNVSEDILPVHYEPGTRH
jgi:hypothetical protein